MLLLGGGFTDVVVVWASLSGHDPFSLLVLFSQFFYPDIS